MPVMSGTSRSCELRNFRKVPLQGHFERAPKVGETIPSDIVGKLEFSSPDGFIYVVPFVADRSRYTILGVVKSHGDLPIVFSSIAPKLKQMDATENSTFHFTTRIFWHHSAGVKEYVALQNNV